jgi:hypothetical protein
MMVASKALCVELNTSHISMVQVLQQEKQFYETNICMQAG